MLLTTEIKGIFSHLQTSFEWLHVTDARQDICIVSVAMADHIDQSKYGFCIVNIDYWNSFIAAVLLVYVALTMLSTCTTTLSCTSTRVSLGG